MAINSYSRGRYAQAVFGPARQHLTLEEKANLDIAVRVDPEPIQLTIQPFEDQVHLLTYFPNADPIEVDVRIPITERDE